MRVDEGRVGGADWMVLDLDICVSWGDWLGARALGVDLSSGCQD